MNYTIIIVSSIIAGVLIFYRIMDYIELNKLSDMKKKKIKAIMENRQNPIKQIRKSIKNK